MLVALLSVTFYNINEVLLIHAAKIIKGFTSMNNSPFTIPSDNNSSSPTSPLYVYE